MIGHKLILLHEIDSTNNYAARLLEQGKLEHGTVILAGRQTAGRGQRGNEWRSALENQLAYSVYAETAFLSADRYWYLNLAVSLAVKATVESLLHGAEVRIKWPNDILVNSKKLSGILLETQWRSGAIRGAVIGIGMNIYPEPNLPSACALRDFSGEDFRMTDLAVSLSAQLNLFFEKLRNGEWNDLLNAYEAALWRRDAEQIARLPDGSEIAGSIRGIDGGGNLLFEHAAGKEIKSYGLKEIAFSY